MLHRTGSLRSRLAQSAQRPPSNILKAWEKTRLNLWLLVGLVVFSSSRKGCKKVHYSAGAIMRVFIFLMLLACSQVLAYGGHAQGRREVLVIGSKPISDLDCEALKAEKIVVDGVVLVGSNGNSSFAKCKEIEFTTGSEIHVDRDFSLVARKVSGNVQIIAQTPVKPTRAQNGRLAQVPKGRANSSNADWIANSCSGLVLFRSALHQKAFAERAGRRGSNGHAGVEGHPGQNGPDVRIVLGEVERGASIHVTSLGGPGGDGGRGSNGSKGGSGVIDGSHGDCATIGGPGGRGGDGGAGGPGGKGGDVVVLINQNAQIPSLPIRINNMGGPGGEGGRRGRGGEGGDAARTRIGWILNPSARAAPDESGAKGRSGLAGKSGHRGRVGSPGEAKWRTIPREAFEEIWNAEVPRMAVK